MSLEHRDMLMIRQQLLRTTQINIENSGKELLGRRAKGNRLARGCDSSVRNFIVFFYNFTSSLSE